MARWSSQGDKIHLRADMQAALDTVLARTTPDIRERFEALAKAGTGGARADPTTLPVTDAHIHIGEGGIDDIDSDGDVRRRDLLTGVTISGITRQRQQSPESLPVDDGVQSGDPAGRRGAGRQH